MLIGIDASRANRRHKSGTEWYSYYLIRALAQIDSSNQYILYTDTPLRDGMADLTADGERHSSMPSVDKKGYQLIKSPHGNFSAKVLAWPWRFFWSQGRLSLEMLFRRPDVLFIPAHALPVIHPKKSVVTIHDIGFYRDGQLYGRQRLGADNRRSHRLIDFLVQALSGGKYGANSFDYLDWSTQYALKHASTVLAISEFTRHELVDAYKADTGKIAVVLHAYNRDLYQLSAKEPAKSDAVLARYGIRTPYLFYVGRLEKKKNIATLVEAFALFKQKIGAGFNFKLCLAGDASYGFDEVKYTINEYGLEGDVITTGWAAEEDLPALVGRASAFVFPSNYEGFGIPVLQAMAMGTPVAASDIPPLREVAGENAVFFDPNDPADMAAAFELITSDEQLRQRLIAGGLEQSRQFSWERTARETLRLFEA